MSSTDPTGDETGAIVCQQCGATAVSSSDRDIFSQRTESYSGPECWIRYLVLVPQLYHVEGREYGMGK